jgi:hypothetical protein
MSEKVIIILRFVDRYLLIMGNKERLVFHIGLDGSVS